MKSPSQNIQPLCQDFKLGLSENETGAINLSMAFSEFCFGLTLQYNILFESELITISHLTSQWLPNKSLVIHHLFLV